MMQTISFVKKLLFCAQTLNLEVSKNFSNIALKSEKQTFL